MSNPLPRRLDTPLSRADKVLLRLNRLCTTTAGLDSLLATINYVCYLLAYCEDQTELSKCGAQLLTHFSIRTPATAKAIAPPTSPPTTASSTLLLLASLLTETRTTLRLAALLPLYGQLRSLLSSPATASSSDSIDRMIALISCWFYILYQATENIAHLADHCLFLPALTSLFSTDHIVAQSPGTSPLWYLSNRLWFLGVTLDLIRAIRVLVIAHQNCQTPAEKNKASHVVTAQAAKQVRSDLIVASCWFPLTLNWSRRDGLRGVNDGVIGVLGLFASWEVLRNNWNALVANEIVAAASRGQVGEATVGKEKGE